MDPVPISQAPFQDVREIASSGTLNLSVDLYEDPPDSSKETYTGSLKGKKKQRNQSDHNPIHVPWTMNPPHNHGRTSSEYQEKKKRKQDPFEGTDPRAKRPNDFPIRVGLPQRQPNFPPRLTKSKPKKPRGNLTEDEESWVPDNTDDDFEHTGPRTRAKHKEKEKGKLPCELSKLIKKKGKRKVRCDNADLSKLPKSHNSKFLNKQSVKLWDKIGERKIINQKLLVLDRLDNHEQITEALTNRNLLGTVTHVEPYDEHIIQEFLLFYCNLTKETTKPSSSLYGKVYIRGNFYDFNPGIINNYMGTSNEEQSVQISSEQIALELTAGNVTFEKGKIKAASLTSKYAILQKIALVN
ncbi:PREDICTED: uncharacterized protein LOC109166520 [Ipomoea nil]|uniref:uncharacterized protein LOC109166520 n=1 Tax=Ipomoea nil TaxID=35883 RepID=UPI000901AE28|nr:PREDICTED: uncharacterized protein LOC109166520 [Ipomoea nil]